MFRTILHYVLSFGVFLAIDIVWLGVIAKNLYRDQIGHLLADNFDLLAAFAFYIVFVVGVIVFSVRPGLNEESLTKTLMLAAFFGFVTYATYDLTNLATLKDWPLKVTIIDLAWGTFISSATAFASFYIGSYLGL